MRQDAERMRVERLIIPDPGGPEVDVVLIRAPSGEEELVVIGEHDAQLPDELVVASGLTLFSDQVRDHAGPLAAGLVRDSLMAAGARSAPAGQGFRLAAAVLIAFFAGCVVSRHDAASPVPDRAASRDVATADEISLPVDLSDWTLADMRFWARSKRTGTDDHFRVVLRTLGALGDDSAICKAVIYGTAGLKEAGREHPRCTEAKDYLARFASETVFEIIDQRACEHGYCGEELRSMYQEIVQP